MNRPCFATFGVPVIYIPSLDERPEFAGTPIDLVGIFDAKREIVALGGRDGLDAVSLHTVVEIKLADLIITGDLIEPMAGDDVTVAGLLYRVLDVQPDGKGLAMLILNRIQDPFAF
ncbi:MAG: hypothetical protein HQL99_03605 [Magnetococcales bacterium]|nr:hypothetical protein [Magnetococcales bacterium]